MYMEECVNKIFWVGDSTVQTNDYSSYPQTGIGQVFPLFLKEEYRVCNYAKNGCSTKSFLDEGRLKAVEEQIGVGDYLFIQFGHNDEKREDPSRYTDPFSSFMENLEMYIKVAREHDAYPVLITPMERRCFMDDKHMGIGAHSDYVTAMKQVAEKGNVPLVDLYSKSRMELKKAGEKKSRRWYMYFPKGIYDSHPAESLDDTHLRHDGAVHFASLIARGLKELGGIYGNMLLENIKL